MKSERFYLRIKRVKLEKLKRINKITLKILEQL